MAMTGLTRNFWKLRPFRPLKMSAAQGFARVRISQFHIVLACFSCILPEQGLHLRYTESCPRGRRCDTRNFGGICEFRPPKTLANSGFPKIQIEYFLAFSPAFLSKGFLSALETTRIAGGNRHGAISKWS